MLDTVKAKSQTETATPHPLDPLTAEEITAACTLVRAAVASPENCRFPAVRLEEPTKQELAAGGVGRRAFALTLDVATGEAIEHIVDLGRGEIVGRKVVPNREAPYGQPPVMLEEFFKCEAVVKADPGWRAAMVRRGLSEGHRTGPGRSVLVGFLRQGVRARRPYRACRQLFSRALAGQRLCAPDRGRGRCR
ncbi:Cu2+-containing amine oxidase [Bradyrhizobium sp. SBR1B]|nr:Cu2+-containing amine oxidase [Bradyrhizobium sp. SBR1B]